MGQPVKVSDTLLLDARLMGEATHRSIAGQIEFWARLGRAVAALLGTFLVAVAAFGGLLIWHILRRGRLIRARLNDPRIVRLPDLASREADPTS